LREASDEIEAQGVQRTRKTIATAELVLQVLDGSMPLDSADRELLTEFSGKKRLIVRNKSDLPGRLELPPGIAAMDVSCLTGAGIEEFKDAIKTALWSGGLPSEMLEVMINSRHEDALRRARAAAEGAVKALRGNLGLELVGFDLRAAANAVGEIVGKTATEDLLDAIFSQFCIGK
jgi:tRNA modification GTPase